MKVIHTNNAPAAIGPYSQAIEANGTLYISGQVPFVPETMEIIEGDVKVQTRRVLENITAILKEAGYSLNNVVKCGIFCKDLSEFSQINEVYGEFFSEHKPARFCVEVARLPRDCKIEIDAIAVK